MQNEAKEKVIHLCDKIRRQVDKKQSELLKKIADTDYLSMVKYFTYAIMN